MRGMPQVGWQLALSKLPWLGSVDVWMMNKRLASDSLLFFDSITLSLMSYVKLL